MTIFISDWKYYQQFKTINICFTSHRSKLLTLACLFFAPLFVIAQVENQISFAALAEKIYVQTDNKAYTNESTIWFKAIVTDAVELAPTKLSGVLYVELIAPNEQVLERKLIKLDKGMGSGFFALNRDYPEGTYLLRAYTNWSQNFGQSFFFKDYLKIFASNAIAHPNPIQNVTVKEGAQRSRQISATFNPRAVDPDHSKELTVFLSFDEFRDTAFVKKNADGVYALDVPVPEQCQFATFHIETKNKISYSRTIILTKDYVDLQFFPEGGDMIHGLPCVLGFKATDSIGKGKKVSGEIINRAGEIVATFNSNGQGMGKVRLPINDSSDQYEARLRTDQSATNAYRTFQLPKAVAKGNAISVMRVADKIQIQTRSNYLMDDSMFVQVSCRGAIYYELRGRLRNFIFEYGLPVNSLPEGVIAFTLLNQHREPIAERLYFNERLETRLRISLQSQKTVYSQREKSQLDIVVTDEEGKPVNTNLSVLVLNNGSLKKEIDTRQTILSHLLLSSDLKGTIENPGYYFSSDSLRHEALDALLLTQGWRKYNYPRDEGTIRFQPEPTLLVSGTVTGGLFTSRQKKGILLTMMTFGKPPFVDTQLTDSLGRFMFSINDLFEQTSNILIQSANNKTGAKKDYTIMLDTQKNPPIEFNHVRAVESPDSTVLAYLKKTVNDKKLVDEYIRRSEGQTLDTVVVSAYAITAERRKVVERFGIPKTVIGGDDIRKHEEKWSYGLYSVLLFNYPDKIRIVRAADGTLYARAMNSEMTLVVIDGIPLRPWEYNLVPNIPPSEVKSVELIEYAKSFSSLYCEIFPTSCLGAPPAGNVIAIYTYGQKGIFGANRAPGIMKAAIPVFAKPREFYAPKHENLKPADWEKPDLRSVIHWAPQIQTDSLGRASISFYNSDLLGGTEIVVEGINEEGYLGYGRLRLEVTPGKD